MESDETNGAAEREARIRHRAYMLWLAGGQPEHRTEEHWRLASEAEAESEHADAGREPDRPDASASTPSSRR